MSEAVEVFALGARQSVEEEAFAGLVDHVVEKCAELRAAQLNARVCNNLDDSVKVELSRRDWPVWFRTSNWACFAFSSSTLRASMTVPTGAPLSLSNGLACEGDRIEASVRGDEQLLALHLRSSRERPVDRAFFQRVV